MSKLIKTNKLNKITIMAAMLWMSIVVVVAAQTKIAIIDAGSGGSRLAVYEVNTSAGTGAGVVKPANIVGVSGSCGPLPNNVDCVKGLIQAASDKSVPVYLLATAGMRFEEIKNNSSWLGYNSLGITAMTISGQYEGFFAWLATGVAKNHFTAFDFQNATITSNKPFGIIEIGGASLQQTFWTGTGKINLSNITFSSNGQSSPYSVSYLGWGINEAWDKSNKKLKSNHHTPLLDTATLRKNLRDKSNVVWYRLGGGFNDTDYVNWLGLTSGLTNPTGNPDWTAGAALYIIMTNAGANADSLRVFRNKVKFDWDQPN